MQTRTSKAKPVEKENKRNLNSKKVSKKSVDSKETLKREIPIIENQHENKKLKIENPADDLANDDLPMKDLARITPQKPKVSAEKAASDGTPKSGIAGSATSKDATGSTFIISTTAPLQSVTQTPKSVGVVGNQPQVAKSTTQTPQTASKSLKNTPQGKMFQSAKQAFRRCATPKKLIGREEERSVISTFIQECLASNQGGSLYISGTPGTGKTALVTEIVESILATKPKALKQVFINCMSTTPKAIFKTLWNNICDSTESDYQEALERYLTATPKAHKIILVLDEIDHLITKDQDVLYSFFEWAKSNSSKLIMIGIANALDLTSRFLPRLKTKNYEPQYLTFAPYKVDEIREIIKDRLRGVEPGTPLTPGPLTNSPSIQQQQSSTPSKAAAQSQIMQPMAIELTARKLAGTGDLRKALDVCRHAIQMVESEGTSQVTVKHILKATSTLFNSNSLSRISTLNMQPRLLLTLLALMIKPKVPIYQSSESTAPPPSSSAKKPQRDYELSDLFGQYRKLPFKKMGIDSLSYSEVQDMVGQLEVCGLVQYTTKKGKSILGLCAGVEEVLKTVKGSPVIDKVVADWK